MMTFAVCAGILIAACCGYAAGHKAGINEACDIAVDTLNRAGQWFAEAQGADSDLARECFEVRDRLECDV